jgi:cystathionine beta-lyase/cystathionine gamma-synthase
MTHASVEPEVRKDRGIGDGLIRLSVGLEDARDLVADINQALNAAAAAAVAGSTTADESEAA